MSEKFEKGDVVMYGDDFINQLFIVDEVFGEWFHICDNYRLIATPLNTPNIILISKGDFK